MSDEIKINLSQVKKGIDFTRKSLKDKRVIWGLVIFLLLLTVIFSSWVRVQNLPLLVDSTTGEYIPVALDPFYFLRIAETMIEPGGLPEFDNFRKPFDVPFTDEILPEVIVLLHKILSSFNPEISLQYVDVISPVIFFALGIILFFLLIYVLTDSKLIAFISSALLSVISPYLYRTMAGFSDHESIGMFAFFLTMLIYSFSLKTLEKGGIKQKYYEKIIGGGLLLGLASAFTVASWGGISTFIFLIIPSSFLLFWLLKVQNLEENKTHLQNFLIFYVTWFISTILFMLPYGFSFSTSISRVFLNPNGMLNGIVFLFLISDFMVIKYKDKLQLERILKIYLEKYRIFASAFLALIIGTLAFFFLGTNIISFISNTINKLFIPIGSERVALTVAENAQPYLKDWIAQLGKWLFWLFYFGIAMVGFEISKGFGKRKNKILFFIVWIAMVSGILFSRMSPSSIFNGSNFISKFVYFGGLLLFLGYLGWVYFKDKIKIKSNYLIIFSWIFLMIIATRSSIRIFFVITPLATFMIGFAAGKLFEYSLKIKDDLVKFLSIILVGIIIVFLITSFIGSAEVISFQAKNTGPSANVQWQQAMKWVRDNTDSEDIFLHWWDYGYWIQSLGKRPTLSDGGHFQGAFRNHLVGRYVLTTPIPETALSFMKTNDVSYLLIDPTDLGKYPAYSKIGSGEKGLDRFSQLPVMVLDSGRTQVTENGELRLYQGGTVVDEDIVYNLNGTQIFLPQSNAFIGAVTLEIKKQGDSISIQQPNGIFVYNGQQIRLPLRYIYVDGQLIDFGSGIESVIKLIPRVTQNNGVQIDNLGSAIYLSPKVKDSLFAQLYLLNDTFGNYKEVKLVHSQADPFIASLNSQGANLGEFVGFRGFRGPIKIWKIEHSESTKIMEEFLRRSGDYAEFDNLTFVK